MRKEDLVVSVVCLLTAALVLVQSVPRYFTDRGAIGSGAFPSYVALLIGACGLSILAQWLTGNRREGDSPFLPSGVGGRRLAYLSGSLVAHRIRSTRNTC